MMWQLQYIASTVELCETALMVAARKGCENIVRMVTQCGASVNLTNKVTGPQVWILQTSHKYYPVQICDSNSIHLLTSF